MFETEVRRNRKVSKMKETTLKVTKSDGGMITPEEVQDYVDKLIAEADERYPEYKIAVRALSPIQWFSLKGFKDDEVQISAVDEYLNGRVHDASEKDLGKFYQLEICLMR